MQKVGKCCGPKWFDPCAFMAKLVCRDGQEASRYEKKRKLVNERKMKWKWLIILRIVKRGLHLKCENQVKCFLFLITTIIFWSLSHSITIHVHNEQCMQVAGSLFLDWLQTNFRLSPCSCVSFETEEEEKKNEIGNSYCVSCEFSVFFFHSS